MLWRITICLCTVGAIGTVSSYGRYRYMAGPYPPMSSMWPLWGVYFLGPFMLLALAAVFGREDRGTSATVLVGSLFVSGISLLDASIPVPEQQMDPEIEAGLRVFGASIPQYLASLCLGYMVFVRRRRND